MLYIICFNPLPLTFNPSIIPLSHLSSSPSANGIMAVHLFKGVILGYLVQEPPLSSQ